MHCSSNTGVPVPNKQLRTWYCTQTPLLIMILMLVLMLIQLP